MTIEFVLKRLGLFLLIIVVAGTINFLVPRLRDTNPIEQRLYEFAAQGGLNVAHMDEMVENYSKKFGLDQPLWKQYLSYWADISRLDFGKSIAFFPADVKAEILRALPWTVGLLTVATIMAFLVGSLFGAWLAWPRAPRVVKALVPILMTLTAIPYYLLGILMIFGFAIFWPILPAGGAVSYNITPAFNYEAIVDILKHAILPAFSLVLASIGFWGLGMRGMMITTMGEDYMKLAEYKGLSDKRIFLRYAVRNAMLPQITGLAIQMAFIVSGSVLVEVIFAYPGVGFLLFEAISANDFLLMQGILMFVIVAIGISLLVIDLMYPLIDPRIRYRKA